MHQSDQVAAVDVTEENTPTWQARAERAEARVAQLEARFRYLRDALRAVSDD